MEGATTTTLTTDPLGTYLDALDALDRLETAIAQQRRRRSDALLAARDSVGRGPGSGGRARIAAMCAERGHPVSSSTIRDHEAAALGQRRRRGGRGRA